MSNEQDVSFKTDHLLQLLQTKIDSVSRAQVDARKPGLQWGQFVVSGGDKPQVGVYGSSCAAMILNINRDDDVSKEAVIKLQEYLDSEDAEMELAHNIKLVFVCLALLPMKGAEATEKMTRQLGKLLERYQPSTKSWPAFSVPDKLAATNFKEPPSPVASAIIVIGLCEIQRRLSHPAQWQQRKNISDVLPGAASRLEGAIKTERNLAERHGALLATAILLVKGKKADASVNVLYREAVQARDFADRRVFFYDCLKIDGTLHRDYFILPVAVLLPLVADCSEARAMQQVRAVDVGSALCCNIDNEGLFKGGQELPSTVEQGLVALALASTGRAVEHKKMKVRAAQIWLNLTQPSPTGRPTKAVLVFVFLLWASVVFVVAGKYLAEVNSSGLIGAIANGIARWSAATPDPIADFLPFLAAAWPPSRNAFMHIIKWRKRESL